ncbi:MAG: hypothetical protein HRT72_09920 [Flavobacteriales bacterium]|nr:hypothetical protein [Flavobacteriales bacterium]
MLNRLTTIAIIFSVTFLTMGWTTENASNSKKEIKIEDAAIVSIYFHKEFLTTGFSGIQENFNKLTQTNIFNYETLMLQVHDRLMDGSLGKLPFNLLPEETVLSTSGYDNRIVSEAKTNKFKQPKIAPEGYVEISEMGKGPIIKAKKVFESQTAIIIIALDYGLSRVKQIDKWATTKVQVRIRIKAYDKVGKKMYKVAHDAISDTQFEFDITNLYEKEEIRPLRDLAKEATDNLFNTIGPAIEKRNIAYEKYQIANSK